jgi:hypothetical protein
MRRLYFLTVLGLLLVPIMSLAQEHSNADGNLPSKSFTFTTGTTETGNDQDFYKGQISISPYCGVKGGSGMSSSSSTIPDGQLRITWYPEERAKLVQLAGSGSTGVYNQTSGYYPYQRVSAVRIQFDKGEPQEKTRTDSQKTVVITAEPQGDFTIPGGAGKVVSVEIDYPTLLKDGVYETHTLKWDAQETAAHCYWGSPKKFLIPAP